MMKAPLVVQERDEGRMARLLTERFGEAASRARRDGRPVLVSVSTSTDRRDPVAVFAAARARGVDVTFWHAPWQDTALVGVGTAWSAAGAGPERFAQLSAQWRTLAAGASVVVDESLAATSAPSDDAESAAESGTAAGGETLGPTPGPVLLGGFAFEEGGATGPWEAFGDGRLDLPRVMYGDVAGRVWVTVNTVVRPSDDADELARAAAADLALEGWPAPSDERRFPSALPPVFSEKSGETVEENVPSKERWLAAVEEAASAIRDGALEKAVLARSVRMTARSAFDVAAALRYLEVHYPECYIFAVTRGGDCFLGATPERIVHKAQGRVQVACVAGSIGRGPTPEEDERLGRRLLSDAKNLTEHRVVLRAILESLAAVCVDVSVGETGLRKLANVQHLYTPVEGRAADGVDVLALVARVHPTPAIAGYPREAALAFIREKEGWARGWYAGPVGWMDAAGDGEFAVGLRSALVRGDEALLFAGCGIMGDSRPESEYEESVLKLRPMRAALGARP